MKWTDRNRGWTITLPDALLVWLCSLSLHWSQIKAKALGEGLGHLPFLQRLGTAYARTNTATARNPSPAPHHLDTLRTHTRWQ